MDEAGVIEAVRRTFGELVPPGAFGFTDDAAALPAVGEGCTRVVTTDVLVEGVDFAVELYPAGYIGRRAIAQNISDLSAMGARPVGFVWSLALPPRWIDDELVQVRALSEGAAAQARLHQVPLFGGDLSRTEGPLVLSITAFGDVRTPVLRSGARAGDAVWLSGAVGGSAAGLRILRQRRAAEGPFDAWLGSLPPQTASLVHAHIAPVPADPEILHDASAAIDVSDGLALDAHRLARASGVRLVFEDVPRITAPGASRADALFGGEDYCLLFTARDEPRSDAIRVGRVEQGTGVWEDGRPLPHRGYDHFADAESGETPERIP